jgi:hypothetical protein
VASFDKDKCHLYLDKLPAEHKGGKNKGKEKGTTIDDDVVDMIIVPTEEMFEHKFF